MKRPGFTLIEVLVSISLAAMVLYGIMHLYQVVVKQVGVTRDMVSVQRTASVLLRQLRVDLTAAIIPFYEADKKKDKDAGQPQEGEEKDAEASEEEDDGKPQDTPEAIKKRNKILERYKDCFLVDVDENADIAKIEGKKFYPLKILSFITTSAFSVYSQRSQRLVRVIYELKPDKKQSSKTMTVFQLHRKETTNLKNHLGKVTDDNKMSVRDFVVAERVKAVYLRCSMLKKDFMDPKLAEKRLNNEERLEVPKWGHIPETQGVVPQLIEVWVELWEENRDRAIPYTTAFCVASYPTLPEHKRMCQVKKQKIAQQPSQRGAGARALAGEEGAAPGLPTTEQMKPILDIAAKVVEALTGAGAGSGTGGGGGS